MRIHGMAGSSEYSIWNAMISRCENPRSKDYIRWGARGITVCNKWRESFAQFFHDMGPRPSARHSIERIDNDGNYEPSNCCWIDRIKQARNRRNNTLLEFETVSLHPSGYKFPGKFKRSRYAAIDGFPFSEAIHVH